MDNASSLVVVEIQRTLIDEALLEDDRDDAVVASNVLGQAGIAVDEHGANVSDGWDRKMSVSGGW